MGYLYVKDPKKSYPDYRAMEIANLTEDELKAEYAKTIATNDATDAVIQSVVAFLKEKNYQNYPVIKALVEDALDQYSYIKETKEKADEAKAKGDLNQAILWENQVWQYLVKAADVGLRAKNQLARELATPMSRQAEKGEEAFHRGGCSGCHVVGKVSSGPDLTGALLRHENAEQFLYEFILTPEKHYNNPYIDAMIKAFNLRMPNQNMKPEEVHDIIEYMKWIDENAGLH